MTSGDNSLWDFDEDEGAEDPFAEPEEEPPPAEEDEAEDEAPAQDGEPPPPARPEPAPQERAPEGDEEAEEEVGESEVGQSASAALVALGRAARSYLLYEPDNEAIRTFLTDLRDKMYTFLQAHGNLVLVIRPWEMVLGTEVVYLNRDRERSLSFRLFRDGVRRITFATDMPWEELTQFLGIISIRYTGIRQQEDDIVTLLWKAGFQQIQVDSVEGFVPEEDDVDVDVEAFGGEGGGSASAAAIYADAPRSFDAPWPEYKKRVPLTWQPLDPARLNKLQEEDSNLALPGQCARLLREILTTVASPIEPMQLSEAAPIINEVRDFLLSEGLLSSLLDVMRTIAELPVSTSEQQEQVVEMLQAFSDVRALSRIIRSVPSGTRELPAELLELVESVPGDRLPLLLQILNNERRNTARWITRALIVRMEAHRVDYLATNIARAEPPVAADLLQVVSEIDLDRGVAVSLGVGKGEDVVLQLAGLGVLEEGRYSKEVGQHLASLLDAPSLEVRLRALKLLADKRERWAFISVVRRLERHANKGMEHRESEAMGRAMVAIWPERAQHQFVRWLGAKKLIQRVLPGQQNLKWAVVSGLVMIPGEQSQKLMRMVAKSASEDLHRHCMKCLVMHRRGEGEHD